jgi:hypothetical protein
MILSDPRRASNASGRSRPCVSEIMPIFKSSRPLPYPVLSSQALDSRVVIAKCGVPHFSLIL